MKFAIDIIIVLVLGSVTFFVYQIYAEDVRLFLSGNDSYYTVYINNVALSVTVADDTLELQQGLSNIQSIKEFVGKLFVFPNAQRHGIWMKDMLFPVDIMWFDDNLKLIHVEHNVHPDTFDTVFAPDADARFVLETNAHFVKSLQIAEGDRISLPAALIPQDIKRRLQE